MTDLVDSERSEWESVEDAEDYRDDLIQQIQGIQAQLGSHGLDENGYKMGLVEWESWRRRAKDALKHKTAELRAVKAWIKEYNRTGPPSDRSYIEMTVGELAGAITDMTRELARRAREAE